MLKDKESKMWQLCNNNIDSASGRTAFDAMRLGDETAKKVVDNYIYYVTVGVINIINTFQNRLCFNGSFPY